MELLNKIQREQYEMDFNIMQELQKVQQPSFMAVPEINFYRHYQPTKATGSSSSKAAAAAPSSKGGDLMDLSWHAIDRFDNGHSHLEGLVEIVGVRHEERKQVDKQLRRCWAALLVVAFVCLVVVLGARFSSAKSKMDDQNGSPSYSNGADIPLIPSHHHQQPHVSLRAQVVFGQP